MNSLKNKPFKTPFNVILNLTTKCNLSCKHCFGDYVGGKEFNFDQLKRIVDELVKNEVFYVNITGGEPTQHPFFKEFIDYLGEKGVFFMLTTNGIFSKDVLETITRNKKWINNIKVSLDGPDSESYGFIRAKENVSSEVLFNRCTENIKELSKQEVPISISTVLHSKNIKKLEDFLPLFEEINIKSWLLSPITFVGRAEKNKESLAYSEGVKELVEEILVPIIEKMKEHEINVKLVDFPFSSTTGRFHFECGATVAFCEIHSDGIVSPCALARISMHEKILNFENILEKPLKDIWMGEPFNKFREFQNTGCKGCVNLEKCNRCVPQGFLYFGDVALPPPFCVSIGEKLCLEGLGDIEKLEGYKKWQKK